MKIDEVTKSSFELYCSIYADKYIKKRGLNKNLNLLEIEKIKDDVCEDVYITVNCLIESSIESLVKDQLDKKGENKKCQKK